MAKSAYPTGVENHGGTLRIWFIYKGSRVRESLGVPDTPKTERSLASCARRCAFRLRPATSTMQRNSQTRLT